MNNENNKLKNQFNDCLNELDIIDELKKLKNSSGDIQQDIKFNEYLISKNKLNSENVAEFFKNYRDTVENTCSPETLNKFDQVLKNSDFGPEYEKFLTGEIIVDDTEINEEEIEKQKEEEFYNGMDREIKKYDLVPTGIVRSLLNKALLDPISNKLNNPDDKIKHYANKAKMIADKYKDGEAPSDKDKKKLKENISKIRKNMIFSKLNLKTKGNSWNDNKKNVAQKKQDDTFEALKDLKTSLGYNEHFKKEELKMKAFIKFFKEIIELLSNMFGFKRNGDRPSVGNSGNASSEGNSPTV